MKKDLAISQGVTMFSKTVIPAKDRKTILQSAKSNPKLGNGETTVTRKKWKGMPMYSLTLEERATCPRDCRQWNDCYGNHSHMRIRVQIDETFYEKLESELRELNRKHAQGFIVRLHVLGDFPDRGYVDYWHDWMAIFKNLHVFGYTHHPIETGMGWAIQHNNIRFEDRHKVRFSDSTVPFRANVETLETATGIVCPEQTGKTKSCLTCGLCWTIPGPITFLKH